MIDVPLRSVLEYLVVILSLSSSVIADDLIINVDQTASKFVATDNITIAAKGERHISRAGATDKRTITVTLYVSPLMVVCYLSSSFIPGKQKNLYQTSLFLMDFA